MYNTVTIIAVSYVAMYVYKRNYSSINYVYQRCNRVTNIDPDDPLTHWLRPSDPDNDPDVTRIKFF